jgi:hypothetical protein
MPEIIFMTIDEGRVSQCDKHPNLLGMNEADIDAAFLARDDVLLVKILYASQDADICLR